MLVNILPCFSACQEKFRKIFQLGAAARGELLFLTRIGFFAIFELKSGTIEEG